MLRMFLVDQNKVVQTMPEVKRIFQSKNIAEDRDLESVNSS